METPTQTLNTFPLAHFLQTLLLHQSLQSPSINLGFGADDIRPAANVAFLKKNPQVQKLLEVASIPLADIAAQNMQMNKGEKSERQVKDHAKAWIKINQKTFDSWIAAAK